MRNRLRRTIEQLGWVNTIFYLLHRLFGVLSGDRWALYKYYFVAQAVATASLCHGRGKTIEVRLCKDPNDLPSPYPRPVEVVAQRFAQGAQSLTAFKQGRMVGFLWFLFDRYQEDEVRASYQLLSAQSVWDFDVYVKPEDRLGFVFPRLWDEANRLLHARAVRWSCSRISAFNAGSLAAHAKIGTAPLGTVVFLRCGSWQWMFATLAPYFHLSLGPASFPQLQFDTSGLTQFHAMEPSCNILKK
jgi:hypothetical protein